MPIYEYACPKCQIAFDSIQRIKDEPLKTCPICHKNTLKKIFSVPHVKVADNPRTVGEMAEYNTKRMSKDELQEKTALKQEKRKQGMKEIAKKVGGQVIEQTDEVPWWRDGSCSSFSEKPVDTHKISNIRKYIETGNT